MALQETDEEIYSVDYTAKILNYNFMIFVEDERVAIGCSFESPFGADSLFEIGIPCDSILEIPDGYYPDQLALGFWYGDSTERRNCTMQLLKRPDGHLKVWPACPFPQRHSLHTEIWGSEDPSKANQTQK